VCDSALLGRELIALGHDVRLMPPNYVKAYVKRNKNDAADAEAICEAVRRPAMRFVPVKTADQQAILMMHRARALLVRQRTMLVNALRGHLAEFGIVGAQGLHKVEGLMTIARNGSDERVPEVARRVLSIIASQLDDVEAKIAAAGSANARLAQEQPDEPPFGHHSRDRADDRHRDCGDGPGPERLRNGREFAAWLGLVRDRTPPWQGAPRRDQQAGRQLSPPASGPRRTRGIVWSKAAKADPWLISLRAESTGLSRRWRWRTRRLASPGLS